jgi:integrase
MTVRRIKKSWWVDFRHEHARYRKRSPDNSQAGAKAYEATLRQKLARGERIDAPEVTEQAHTLAQFADKWFEEYVVPNNKHQEQRMKRYILNSSLVPFFGRMPLEKITTQHIEQYKAYTLKQGVKAKTLNNRLAVLGKCIRTAYEWHKLQGVQPKIVLLRCPPPTTGFLSPDECALLLSKAEGVVQDMMLTALRTGMRQGELRGLQWSSIHWENRTITVRHSLNDRTKKLESPKSNRERHIPIDIDVYSILFRRKKDTGYVFSDADGKPFDSQYIIRRLDEARSKAGLRKFTWHSLRHTFASQLAMKGAPLHAVQALLGHSSISTTMRYAHVAPSALRTAIDMLNPKTAMHTAFGQPVGNQWSEAIEQEARKA